MLVIFRRHTPACRERHGGKDLGRKFRKCNCPIHAEGRLRGVMYQRALHTRNWEAALAILKEIEVRGTWNESPEDKQAAIRKSLPKAVTFYTPQEVAAMLKVGTAPIAELIQKGKLRAIRIGGELRISEAALNKCLDALVAEPESESAPPPPTGS